MNSVSPMAILCLFVQIVEIAVEMEVGGILLDEHCIISDLNVVL